MQASIESTGNLERRLSFSLPEDRLQSHIVGRLGEIARTTRIKGFRPGKVPAKVIEQRFGPQVRAEALQWAARLAQTSPLLHGLLVSLMGALLISLMTRPYSVNTLLFSALWFSALGVTGAWWWRRRAAQSTRVDGSLTN